MKKFFDLFEKTPARVATLLFAAFAFVSLALFSCSDMSSGSGAGVIVPDASKAYVKIAGVQMEGAAGISKTVLPGSLTVDDFTDWDLNFERTGGVLERIASADTFAELTDGVIEITNPSPDGDKFVLRAKRGDVQFKSDPVTATLTPGVAASLTFLLKTGTGNGSFYVKVNFTGGAAAADWTLYKNSDVFDSGEAEFSKSGAGGSAVVKKDPATQGTYTLEINFYGDEGKTIPLNTYSELVRVLPGYKSQAERDIDLNALYKITYKNLPDDYTIEGGGTLPLNYSRKSNASMGGEIMIPSVAASGKYFAGWYTSPDFAPDNSVSMISARGARDVELYACLADTFYVAASGGDDELHSGYSSSQAFSTVDRAVGLISSIGITQVEGDTPYAYMDWTIVIDGALNPDTTTILGGLLDSRAGSVTLKGARGNAFDSLTSDGKGTVINVMTATPICIEGLKIFAGGGTDDCGGIKLSGDNYGNPSKVTLKAGALVTGNDCTSNGGAVKIEFGELIMESGSVIEGNTASGKGAGVYAVPESGYTAKVTMNGSARFGSSDYVCLGGGATINIAGALEYNEGARVLECDAASGTTLPAQRAKFSVLAESGSIPWYLTDGGLITKFAPSYEGNIDIYVSGSDGDDTNGNGSAANPYATAQRAVDYIADNPHPKADYIIHITGTIAGSTVIADEDAKPIKAKSITLQGETALVSGEPQDVLDGGSDSSAPPVLAIASQGLTVTVKNLKITNGRNGGLVVGDETISSNVVLDGGVYIESCLSGGDGAGVCICKDSSVTMKDGCLIDGNMTGMGSCGGVSINQGSFFMQGGTISNNSGKNGKIAVYVGGRFEMSGNATVTSSNGSVVSVPVYESEPGTYTVPYPVIIAGDLTQSSAATISPGGGGTFDLATYQTGLQLVSEASSGLLAANYAKFAVESQYVSGSYVDWHIDENGKLQEGAGD